MNSAWEQAFSGMYDADKHLPLTPRQWHRLEAGTVHSKKKGPEGPKADAFHLQIPGLPTAYK